MTSATESGVAPTPRKPRISYFIATTFGLGYLKPGPGTWGSLASVLSYTILIHVMDLWRGLAVSPFTFFVSPYFFAILFAVIGTAASNQVVKYSGKKDPQFVVIDEVSGQWLTLLLGTATVGYATQNVPFGSTGTRYAVLHFGVGAMNWKYLLMGFILFRVFDIWKPFPVRQAESLPGGWGIMADDWVAALYAAAGLWVARWLGL
jgi:phosphatidylglycerophosphatase A